MDKCYVSLASKEVRDVRDFTQADANLSAASRVGAKMKDTFA